MDNNLFDLIVEELLEKHSISALLFMLERGREINFSFKSSKGGIYWEEENITLYIGKENVQKFENAWKLVNDGTVNNKRFFQIWAEIEVEVLF